MKFIKSKNIFALSLLMLFSFQTSAGLNDATWYVTLDVDKMESNELYKVFEENMQKSIENGDDDFIMLPKEISHISLYGNAKGAEDATAVIHGDYSQFSIHDFALDFLYTQEDISEYIKERSMDYKNNVIQVLELEENEEINGNNKKSLYFSEINSNLTVISFQLEEIKNWLDNNYKNHSINSGELFSVVVDVKSALAHMGINIDKNTHMMQSEIFQKVTQASASVSEVNSDMVLDVALTTADDATATQIEQVINGLIAMNNLSGVNDENELHATFMQNLNIERNGNNIIASSYASIEDLKKEALQDQQHEKKVKVKVNK